MCCLKSIQIFIFKSCDCLFPWWPLVEWQSRIFLRFRRIFHVLFRWFFLSSDRFYYTPQLSTRPVWRRLEKSLKDWFENVSDFKKHSNRTVLLKYNLYLEFFFSWIYLNPKNVFFQFIPRGIRTMPASTKNVFPKSEIV